MGRLSTLGQRLYTGKVSYDFVGRRRIWYTISAIIVVFAASGLLVKGINQGVEFRGGVEFTAQIEPTDQNVDEIRDAVIDSGVEVGDPIVTTSGNDAIRVQVEPLNTFESAEVRDAILATGASDVSLNQIGPQWGQEVADSAIRGLVIFVCLVILFIWAYFREWKMSVAAIVALAHVNSHRPGCAARVSPAGEADGGGVQSRQRPAALSWMDAAPPVAGRPSRRTGQRARRRAAPCR